MVNIKLIIGSTRPNRFGPKPAQWLQQLAADIPDAKFELVDLADFKLPLLDVPMPPMMGQPHGAHVQQWADTIGEADGYIIITPEYNHSYPAALKNAIDYLYREWLFKPVGFASYGASAAGVRAIEHLRAVAGQLQMFDLSESVSLPLFPSPLSEDGQFQATPAQEQAAKAMLTQVAFWARHMRAGRQELAKISQ